MGFKTTLLAGVAVSTMFAPMMAFAQDAEAPASVAGTAPDANAAPQDVSEITVTGSRVAKNGNDSPTPVSVVTAEDIAKSAPVTVADYVNQLPALSGSNTPRTPQSSVGTATGGANLLNLRNLGPNRTLVLLNGRRATPSFLTGVVDINTLPTALIKSVDVVTGGASASYGSDAVSGVVNFVLDTKFTGIKGSFQGGTSTYGDSASYNASLSAGTGFADGRGHVIVSASYAKQEPAFLDGRGWYKGYKILANPRAGQAGQPANLILPNSSLNTTNYGLIGSGPLRGTAFNATGGVATTNFPFGSVESGFLQSGGTANDDNTLGNVVQLGTGLEQGNIFGRVSFDATDDITLFAEGSYGKAKSSNQSGLFWRVGTATVNIDNAYLPASVRQAMVNAGVTSFPLSTNNRDIPIATGYYTRDVLRLLAGAEGKFGSNWRWSLSYQYGKATAHNEVLGDIRPARYNLAIDSVLSNGQIVCRSTLTNPTNGCVPYNPLGSRPLTDAQRAYLIGASVQDVTYRQDVVEGQIQGDLFQLPAGPVSIAFGGEYRSERAVATSDAESVANSFYVGNFKPFQGKFNVKEAFGEILVPILKDSALGDSLNLNGAIRFTDYSTSGSVTTWKIGAVYQPIPDLRFRITRSRDIRAPNLNELFQGGTFAQQTVLNPFRNNASDQFNQQTAGNPNLQPEIARSLTAGVVITPSFLPGFSASVDYYDISIRNSIATLSAQFIVNQCFAGVASFCSVISPTPTTGVDLTGVSVIPFNARTENARGFDFEVSYIRPVGQGTLGLRVLANYASKLDIVSSAGTITRAGEAGTNLGVAPGVPHLTGMASLSYDTEPMTLQLKGRFIGSAAVEQDYTAANVNQDRNHVPAVVYIDAFLGFNVESMGGKFQFFLAGDNLFNRAPPVAVSQDNTNTQTPGTNVFLYDVIGRTLRAGVNFKF